MNFLCLCLVFLSLFFWACPRVFLWTDRYSAHRHLDSIPSVTHTDAPIQPSVPKRRRPSIPQERVDYPRCLDELARSTRSQISARDALIQTLSVIPKSQDIGTVLANVERGEDIVMVLSASAPKDYEQGRFISFLLQSLVVGIFIPQALEQAASILRAEIRQKQDLEIATAQTRLAARILTLLPFVLLAVLLAFSATSRHSIFSASSILLLTIGFSMNRMGWLWIQRMIAQTNSESSDMSLQLAENLCIALRAGIPLHQAIEKWSAQHDEKLHESFLLGHSLSNALHQFAQRVGGGAESLGQMLITAERDGLPIAHTIGQLTSELRQQRRHSIEVKLRQLPTKLALPIVFLVLPSFVLLTVVPLVIANFAHFQFSPPPITTPV